MYEDKSEKMCAANDVRLADVIDTLTSSISILHDRISDLETRLSLVISPHEIAEAKSAYPDILGSPAKKQIHSQVLAVQAAQERILQLTRSLDL